MEQAENSERPMDVLLVDADTMSRATIKNYLTAQGARVVADVDNITSGLHLLRGSHPDIFILELPPSPEETLEAVRRIRNDYPKLGIILSSDQVSSEIILRSIRAGAQEFLSRPLDIRELGEAVTRISTSLRRTVHSDFTLGQVITLFANKGGLGVTSIATNLAICLSRQDDTRTAILDLNNFQRGDVDVMLDLHPSFSLVDAVGEASLDETMLDTILTSYDRHLFMLSGPTSPEDSEKISSFHLVELFSLLREKFDYIIVDAGRTLDSRMLEVFNLADLILLVVELSVLSIRNVRDSLGLFKSLGYPEDKVRLVVNRYRKKSKINLEDLEKTTGAHVFWKIPNDYPTMNSAIDAGTPVVIRSSRSEVTRNFERLARELRELVGPVGKESQAQGG